MNATRPRSIDDIWSICLARGCGAGTSDYSMIQTDIPEADDDNDIRDAATADGWAEVTLVEFEHRLWVHRERLRIVQRRLTTWACVSCESAEAYNAELAGRLAYSVKTVLRNVRDAGRGIENLLWNRQRAFNESLQVYAPYFACAECGKHACEHQHRSIAANKDLSAEMGRLLTGARY